jgi:hypothetical protein
MMTENRGKEVIGNQAFAESRKGSFAHQPRGPSTLVMIACLSFFSKTMK